MWLQFLKRAVFAVAGGALACGLAMLITSVGHRPTIHAQDATGGQVGVQDIFDQTTPGSGAFISSIRLSGTNAFNKAADDFQVGAAWWIVSSVRAVGVLEGGSPPQDVQVEFYQNSTSNLPGTLLFSQPGIVVSPPTSGDLFINLPTFAVLRSNQTYWLVVQAQTTFGNRWLWGTRNSLSGFSAAYLSSSLPGCREGIEGWAPRANCESTIPGPDQLFSITYTPFTPTAFVYLPLIRR